MHVNISRIFKKLLKLLENHLKMSKFKLFQITILVILFIFLILPQVVNAASSSDPPLGGYSKGIVPCGRECVEWKDNKPGTVCTQAGTGPDGKPIDLKDAQPCGICHFFIMIQRVLNGISIVLFIWVVLYVVIGGITILTAAGSAEQISKGKKMITYAIIGVVIALSSWIIINETMLLLVGEYKKEGVMPWPWDKIECSIGEIPVLPQGDDGGNGWGPPIPGDTAYCVCETPRYSLRPDQIGTDIRVTQFSNNTECEQACVVANTDSYCPNSSLAPLPSNEYNLYCASTAMIETKKVCRLALDYDNTIIGRACKLGNTCYDSDQTCKNVVETIYRNECFLDNLSLCESFSKGYSTLCPSGGQVDCPIGKYRPVKWQKEKEFPLSELEAPGKTDDAYECSKYSYTGSAEQFYCRLNCEYIQCPPEQPVSRCNELSPEGNCVIGGKIFTCRAGVKDQLDDMCDELEDFLVCMTKYIVAPSLRIISSISDNSDRACFNVDTWDKRGQCSSESDSCTGTCCGHMKYSFHYGGKPTADETCRKCSWAVDFAVNPGEIVESDRTVWQLNYGLGRTRLNQFEDIAVQCSEELEYKGKTWKELGWDVREKDVIGEENHIHIELENMARKRYRCWY